MAYRFEAKVAARGSHIYRNLTWENIKPGDKVTVELETNDESKKSTSGTKTVGHIPREISRHVFFYLSEENGKIEAGGLEILLMLTFKRARYITHEKMKEFVTSLYSYEFEPQEKSDTDDCC